MRETFSLFVTLELGAEEKSTVKAIKREEGGEEQKESSGPLFGAHHFIAGRAWWPCVNQVTTLHCTGGSALPGTSARLALRRSGENS